MKTDALNRLHQRAEMAWDACGKRGTVEIITGHGKTKLALNIAAKFPADAKVLFLAETVDRERDLNEQKEIWEYDGPKIEFMCYQSAYRLENTEWDLVIADEIHDSLTPVYSSFYFKNKYKCILGLTATLDEDALVDPDDIETKRMLVTRIAPVCFRFTVDDGQIEGTARKINVYVIRHSLNVVEKVIPASNKKGEPDPITEYAAYAYWTNEYKRAMFFPGSAKNFRIRYVIRKRAELLYNLPSKIYECKRLLEAICDYKTVIFSNSLDALEAVTKYAVSSRKTKEENDKIRDDFDNNKITNIGSFKKLKQGANLKGVDICVMLSYYGKEKDVIQRIGRLRDNGKVGRVFIFVTKGTQEEVWYNKMMENITSYNIIECEGIDDCLVKFKDEVSGITKI